MTECRSQRTTPEQQLQPQEEAKKQNKSYCSRLVCSDQRGAPMTLTEYAH